MATPEHNLSGVRPSTGSSDKQALALQALSQLAGQFASDPDIKRLSEVLVLTISGQFAAGNVFLLLRNPEGASSRPLFHATGQFKQNMMLTSLTLAGEDVELLNASSHPTRTSEIDLAGSSATFAMTMQASDVSVVAPLRHDDHLLGMIGLGRKLTGKPYGDVELDLLHTVVKTITPFVANSFLFWKIHRLGEWNRRILNNFGQACFVFDRRLNMRMVNAPGEKLMRMFQPDGPAPETATGQNISSIFSESAFPGWAERIRLSRSRGQVELIESMVARRRAGESIFNIRVSTIAEQDGSGDLIVTLDDVTERKDNEQRLFELQKLAEKGSMASSIAHELNNFLAMIMGGIEIAELAIGRQKWEKVSSSMERTKEVVQKMKRFTSGLMDYGRSDSKKTATNLNDLIRDVLGFVKVQKRFSQIAIGTEFQPDLPSLLLDADEVSQLLLNLLYNAADAIAEAKREKGWIAIETRLEEQTVLLQVADNGAGMSPEIRDKLFKVRFTSKDKGHGFGLTTCARVLENHKAETRIESKLGEGSTFIFRFPISCTFASDRSE